MSSDQKSATATTDANTFQVNQKKLKELQESANAIKIGGKGTARRKKKVIHRPANADDKKLQSSLRKLSANNLQGIEEVNMFKENGEVIHFSNPKVQASLGSNTFAVTGQAETKSLQEMLPTIMSQIGMPTDVAFGGEGNQRKGDAQEQAGAEPDEDVPDLVENFDDVSNSK